MLNAVTERWRSSRQTGIGDLDFSLKPNSAAVDAGCKLPNLNDDFSGKAPDLGALEVGKPLPVYGPRR